jgi:amino acid transporter
MHITKLSSRSIGAIAIATDIIAFLLLTLPYYFFPSFYVSKSNQILGYRSPATLEGWVILAIALLLVVVTTVVLYFYAKRRIKEEKRLIIKQL